ncbi:MAG: ABC transporter permease [Alphaproteobacteria bacterium]|nr:ABC transporter permease [Alphaproteobacteria bacterium]MBV9539881.1 ABC transporter permease [Alphaproteobacteria bacterium]
MIANALMLALREIRNNLLRAGLTTLGIVIGVAAVIAMVTLGAGATQSVTTRIASMGRNLLFVSPARRGPISGTTSFEESDADAIAREVPGLIAVAPSVVRSAVALLGNRNRPTQITGTTNTFFTAREWPVVLGRQFTVSELMAGKAVCVLGETVRSDLFGDSDPIGQRIRLDKVSCEVVGVLQSKGKSSFGQDPDDTVIIPLHAAQRRFAGNNAVNVIWLSVADAGDIPGVKARIADVMRARRHLAADAANDFEVNDMQEIARTVTTITGTLTAFLSAVAAVSLLVGGIGIMNIMLVSVTERTREIGIRLAIGARQRDVLLQFLIEAVVMSAFGGIVGILLGLAGSAALSRVLDLPFIFQPGIVVIAVLFAAGVGVAFGYFPARRAAQLDPIEALRHE